MADSRLTALSGCRPVARLAAHQQGQKTRTHAVHPSLLTGLLFDERGEGLTPFHAKKGSRRYRYCVGKVTDGPMPRIRAVELEEIAIPAKCAVEKAEEMLLDTRQFLPQLALRELRCRAAARVVGGSRKNKAPGVQGLRLAGGQGRIRTDGTV